MSDSQAAPRLKITEIFRSLQGEGSAVGFPTVFVRLTGCPLRCQYCDTAYAFTGGQWMTLDAILAQVADLAAAHVCVTGGEPLAQPNCLPLLTRLCDAGYRVSLETSGAMPVANVDPRVSRVVDVKTPASGEAARNILDQLPLLQGHDQIKFVICDRADYEWSRALLRERGLPAEATVLFSPSHEQLPARELADWILEDRLPVRMQVQLHKILWGQRTGAMMGERHAIVLLSGGLDSATALAIARSQGFICHTLAVSYGQRHSVELQAARALSAQLGAVEHRQMYVDLADIGGSALTDSRIAVPESATTGIPVTYVPARNTLFLALALGWAEVAGAYDIFIGVNAVDYSGYPDCRPDFISAFEALAGLATKAGTESGRFHIQTPLIAMSKAQIIRTGTALGVDYGQTVSCYQANALFEACGRCDSCRLRREGFVTAGLPDPTRYT